MAASLLPDSTLCFFPCPLPFIFSSVPFLLTYLSCSPSQVRSGSDVEGNVQHGRQREAVYWSFESFESSFAVDSVDFQNLLAAAFLAVPFRALCVVCVLVMVRRPGLLLLISMISSYLCNLWTPASWAD